MVPSKPVSTAYSRSAPERSVVTSVSSALTSPWLASMGHQELFGRQVEANQRTCGWLTKNPDLPLPCPKGDACYYYSTVSPYYFACCPVSGATLVTDYCSSASTCVDYTSGSHSAGTTKLVTDGSVLCASSAPYCSTAYLSAYSSDSLVRYQGFDCGTVSGVVLTYYQSTTGHASSSSTSSQPKSTQQHHTTSANSTSTAAAATDHESTTSKTQSMHTVTATSQAGHSSSPAGAIAGGVVGGVIGLALIGAIVFLALRLGRRKERSAPQPDEGEKKPQLDEGEKQGYEQSSSQRGDLQELEGERTTVRNELDGEKGRLRSELP